MRSKFIFDFWNKNLAITNWRECSERTAHSWEDFSLKFASSALVLGLGFCSQFSSKLSKRRVWRLVKRVSSGVLPNAWCIFYRVTLTPLIKSKLDIPLENISLGWLGNDISEVTYIIIRRNSHRWVKIWSLESFQGHLFSFMICIHIPTLLFAHVSQ
jgi:hypothetical protein